MSALFRDKTSIVEWLLGFCMLGWAYVFLINNPLLLATSPSYQALSEIVSNQWELGFLFLTVSLIKLIGVSRDLIWLRFVGALLGAGVWSALTTNFVFASLSLASAVPTGIMVYGAFTVVSFLVAMRHAANVRDAKGRSSA